MHKYLEESLLMRFFRAIGVDHVAWSLRRLYCPVVPEALVLEVGSGGSPYPRANVLLDAYEDTRERHWVPLKADRPIVLGFVERLPFRDKAFDFVIASHVLEHSANPDSFLKELQRVAKAGYIEVPDAFFERLNPYHDHRLEITCRDGELLIRKKAAWMVDKELVEIYQHRVSPIVLRQISKQPFAFHVRYYWTDHIGYTILNPEVDAAWPVVSSSYQAPPPGQFARLRGSILDFMRGVLSQNSRNSSIDLLDLLKCPSCGGSSLSRVPQGLICGGCQKVYPLKGGIPAMFSE